MKKIAFLLALSLCLGLVGCVQESPEPTIEPTTEENTERRLVTTDYTAGMLFGVYSDDTCEILELDPDFNGTFLAIPSTYDNYPVVAIADEAFMNSRLTEIDLSVSQIRTIGEKAFQNTLIKKLVLPDTLELIEKEAFDNCTKLQSVHFGSGLKEIQTGAFCSCSAIKEITLPASIRSLGAEAFGNCSALEKVTLPEGLCEIGEWAFWDCEKITELSFPQTLERVGREAFQGTSWLKAQSGETSVIGNGVLIAYRGTASEWTVPEGILYLGLSFADTSLTRLVLPDSLRGICEGAFEDSRIEKVIYNGTSEEVKSALPR